MERYTVLLLLLSITANFITTSASVCQMGSRFPQWMMGHFHAQFADGSSAEATFGLWYANVTFSTGENGTLTMTKPLQQVDDYYIFHECVQIDGSEPAQRCSLLVRRGLGYIEYIHKDPDLVPVCPESLSASGLEMEVVTRID